MEHLDKKVILWHREAPLFLGVYLQLLHILFYSISYTKNRAFR